MSELVPLPKKIPNFQMSADENVPPFNKIRAKSMENDFDDEKDENFNGYVEAKNLASLLKVASLLPIASLNNNNNELNLHKKRRLPFFRPSRFSNVPPSVRFSCIDEKIEVPKKSIRKMLKWCYNSLIPKVVRRVLINSHFEIVAEDSYWLGYWGRHLKTCSFKKILPYQKVNHFPGNFHLGRKDRLWMNIRKFMQEFDEDEFNLMPKTFILPRDSKRLKEKMKETGQMAPIILKPPASARGAGVRLVHRWSQIPKKDPLIAQTYIENPCLIHGSKFDLRLYIYVTSFNPLKIYLYEDGLVRFASVKYSNSLATIANRLMHLTNYSLNKSAVSDENLPNKSTTGVKWPIHQLWKYFDDLGKDSKLLKRNIVDLIIKTFISCESPVNLCIQQNTNYPFSCHELFGFDVVLDENLKPWLLEVNISPSLQSSTEIDTQVKAPLARDVLNLAGIQVPEKTQIQSTSTRLTPDWCEPTKPYSLDYRTKPRQNISFTEQELKKQHGQNKHFDETGKINSTILDQLTPNDLRILIEFEDEFDRRGKFKRIFPSLDTTKYLKFFHQTRYNNLLLDEWLNQYFHIRPTGIALLESYCKQKIHLETSIISNQGEK